MSDFYGDMRALASGLLTKFSQGEIDIVRAILQSGSAPDNPPVSTFVIQRIRGAVARGVQYKYVMRSLAVASDVQITFASDAVDFSPKITDFVSIDGVRHKITQVIATPAAGTPVVYTLIARY